MVFSSVIFLFLFLPLTLLCYGVAGRKYRNIVLLLASLLFYTWGEGMYLLIMLFSIGLNYACGLAMCRPGGRPSRTVLAVGVGANLAILAFFKYANFIVDNINILLEMAAISPIILKPAHLPIGISFFTFQAVSYIVDIYRKETRPQTSLVDLGLYISMFPQLIAGPIVRYKTIAAELAARRVDLATCAYGIRRFIFGLSKKVLLANPLGEVADTIFALPAAELSPSLAWLGALCYTLQIYFDFSGYSDMAIGLGRIFGFHFLENFNYPYASRSIREFWRRWHISLASWLRDYLYIPLGGNRRGRLHTSFNLLLVFFLCGLWHGASWTFVCWGLFHGFFLIVERTRFGSWMSRWWWPLPHLWTLLIVIVGWVLFRSETIAQALEFLLVMSGMADIEGGKRTVSMMLVSKTKLEICVGLILSLPVYHQLRCRYAMMLAKCGRKTQLGLDSTVAAGQLLLLATLFYLTAISLAAGVYNPFIYFRF